MTASPGGAVPEAGREALSQALVEEGDRLYALALRVTRDPDLAADAVQDGFASALDGLAAFRGEARLSTWLHRIVYNKSIDLLRRRRRESPLPDNEPTLQARLAREGLGPGASWARPPDELLMSVRSHQALERALGALTPSQRAVFELKEVEGRPTDEVSSILGVPPGTVRVYLHRARLRLRALLHEHFERESR